MEEGRIDYEIGFAADCGPGGLVGSIAVEHEFEFTDDCTYTALKAKSEQVKAIDDYEKQHKLPVYYQLYNPWKLPFRQRVPISEYATLPSGRGVGTRIIPAKKLHAVIAKKKKGVSPSVKDIRGLAGDTGSEGWTLPLFITDLFLGCKEGCNSTVFRTS